MDKLTIDTRIGDTIKSFRKLNKMSQIELAKLCGISNVTMCNIEKGSTRPKTSTLEKICDVIEVPIPLLYLGALNGNDFKNDHIRTKFRVLLPIISSIFSQLTKYNMG